MAQIITFFVGWLGKYLGLRVLKLSLITLTIAFSMSFFAFFLSVVMAIYNSISSLLDLMGSGGSSGGVLSCFFGLLQDIGFTSALDSSMPIISSALVFYLTLSLYRTTKNIIKDITQSVGIMGGL